MAQDCWVIDGGHSGIQFSVRHLVISKVRGQFTRWSSNIFVEGDDLSGASVEALIDSSSITTGVADRDAHLKSADFLDVANHPAIVFKSRIVEKLRGNALRIVGNLTIRGVTREVVLDVEDNGRTKDPWGHERAGFAAKAKLDRKEFGLTWNQLLETGGLVVGDGVEVEIEVEAVRQEETKVA
jgi:polyisoprenoid-binding protein YceI